MWRDIVRYNFLSHGVVHHRRLVTMSCDPVASSLSNLQGKHGVTFFLTWFHVAASLVNRDVALLCHVHCYVMRFDAHERCLMVLKFESAKNIYILL